MRAFLAVPADPDWLDATGRLVAHLRASSPRASWTRREAWHLTLKFLGEIPRTTAERIAEDFAPIAQAAAALRLESAGAVVFPPHGRPRVLGLGFAPSADVEALEALSVAAETVVRRAGLPPEDRQFHPHVTLARLREPWPAPAIDAFRRAAAGSELPPWHARACVLYESRLDPGGAVHTPVRTFALAGAGLEVRA